MKLPVPKLPAPSSPLVLAMLTLGTQPALAAERELDAHEHGAATLDVALDGERLYIDLDSPADNVLGFEHAPSDEAQRETVAAARLALASGALFTPTAAAGCTLESADVELTLAGSDEGHDDEEEEHEEEHDSGHSDVTAAYTYLCDRPDALDGIATTLFETFDGFVDIDVQLVGPGGQDAAELSAGDAFIALDAIR